MTNDQPGSTTMSTRRRRRMRGAGWALIAIGVVVSWVWSVELTISGAAVFASLAGAATLLVFCSGIALIWRASPHRGPGATRAFRIAVLATAAGAVVAGVVPVAVTATTTGILTTNVASGLAGAGYRVSAEAVVSSDTYRQTSLDLTVRAVDRTTPQLVATVSFADGTADVRCANTRQTWTHDVSTVTLHCDGFAPISTLRTISGIAVTER